tara:strand:+ start:44 stop:181 length:138 start_codon:yes stop_codon:yes gene_type:complete
MRILAARVMFFFARTFLSRGFLVGQWFQNKAILLLASGEDNASRE